RASYGEVAVTYAVRAIPGGTRLVGRLDVGASTTFERIRRVALSVGDAVMGRKQLLTLKEYAERTAARAA
ncbi:MAG: hypothetical protein ABWZ98_17900, partial [Nakamurella sp.]